MQRNCWLLAVWVLPIICIGECSWGEAGNSQYHIQTDEGPERYFRFQTDNGQFRKEKRLHDGTVIGTDAWIDAAGFLRQQDYIADKKGYRILRSKTVFVGEGRQIEDAIKSTKYTSAKSGVSDSSNNGENRHITFSSTPSTMKINTIKAGIDFSSPLKGDAIQPAVYLGFDHYPDELKHSELPFTHLPVHKQSHIVPLINNYNNLVTNSNNNYERSATDYEELSPTPTPPSLTINPPFESRYKRIKVFSPAPIIRKPIVGNEVVVSRNVEPNKDTPSLPLVDSKVPTTLSQEYFYAPPSKSTYVDYITTTPSALASSPPNANSLEEMLPPLSPADHRRLRLRLKQKNILGGVEAYDNATLARKGFSYFLPRQYHAEEQLNDNKRAGSFGYVDPFGIRRVVYYNASPETGFVHRNKNQYVGPNGVPYNLN